ncbi:MAG TPA: hypothetical protein VME63_11100, partial [Dyella sp.]|uniref:hypothetical protein n=1 Tax=Dyella sp. TaxID=1869338 RepID=UPI002C18D453
MERQTRFNNQHNVKDILMRIDKLPGANGAYLSCDLPNSSTAAAAEPATTSNTKNTTAQTNLQHHDPIGGGTGIDTKPVDYQTWLNHTAPEPWAAGRTYKPGDQVIYGQNVYQLVGAWDSHDIRPDTWRSNWWYSGSVQNNYNYYAKLPPGTAS